MRPRMDHATAAAGVNSASSNTKLTSGGGGNHGSGHGRGYRGALIPPGADPWGLTAVGVGAALSTAATYLPSAAGATVGKGAMRRGSSLPVPTGGGADTAASAVSSRGTSSTSQGVSADEHASGSPSPIIEHSSGNIGDDCGVDAERQRRNSNSRGLSTGAAAGVVLGALVLTTHRVIMIERRSHGDTEDEVDGDAGVLVEIPLAFIVETRVKRRPVEGLAGMQIKCRDKKTYYFDVAKGGTKSADAVLLQGVRRFEDEIAWLIEEDNFAHSVRENGGGGSSGRDYRGGCWFVVPCHDDPYVYRACRRVCCLEWYVCRWGNLTTRSRTFTSQLRTGGHGKNRTVED